jgi:hypothetical protein
MFENLFIFEKTHGRQKKKKEKNTAEPTVSAISPRMWQRCNLSVTSADRTFLSAQRKPN